MSSPSRSPLLPPYATPMQHDDSIAGHARADRSGALSARLPFVPPSFSGALPFSVAGASANSDVALEDHVAPEASNVDQGTRADFGASDAVAQEYASPETSDAVAQALASDQPTTLWPETVGDNGLGHDHDAHLNSDTELPWIEEFDESPPAGAADEIAETWAIDEAGPSIAHIANDLASASAPPATPVQLGAHAPWQDDEAWMDIMPTLPNTGSHDPALDTSWARAFAEPMAPMTPPPIPAGDTQAAAASLELIARRLRAGEISVPGFKAELGDAAALAATLSALLAAR